MGGALCGGRIGSRKRREVGKRSFRRAAYWHDIHTTPLGKTTGQLYPQSVNRQELTMKIAIIGATGNVGTRLVNEALERHHAVTGIARNLSKLTPRTGLSPTAGDVTKPDALVPLLKGHDAIISALRFTGVDPQQLIDLARRSGVKRYLVVGGAASLEIAPGQILLDAPNFPPAYKPEAAAGKAFLDALRNVKDLDWTYVSPSAFFGPGERTGKFRLSDNSLLTAADGKSSISYEDYAVALLDEIEHPKHIRGRFTVGY
jgi:putative NADH-flavin reductase